MKVDKDGQLGRGSNIGGIFRGAQLTEKPTSVLDYYREQVAVRHKEGESAKKGGRWLQD